MSVKLKAKICKYVTVTFDQLLIEFATINKTNFDQLYFGQSNFDQSYFNQSYFNQSYFNQSYFDQSFFNQSYFDQSYLDQSSHLHPKVSSTSLLFVIFSSQEAFDLHQVFCQKIKKLEKDDGRFGYDEMRERSSDFEPGTNSVKLN